MSIKIAKFKNYIKETYEKLGEINYSNYWNLGYINALDEKGIINREENELLNEYNEKVYLNEKMKIFQRGREQKKMELEEIKKRIDGDLQKLYNDNILGVHWNPQIHEALRIGKNALKMYKELVEKVQKMNLISDKKELQIDTNYQITREIKYLEEKYYPKPKSKTVREKINDIINGNTVCLGRGEIIDALVELRDEIPE